MPRSLSTVPESHDLLDLNAARAALGGIGLSTLYRLIWNGDLPVVKVRRRSFIRRADVDAFIERQVRAS
jgi:excisionase family DNA binding protein